MCKGLTGLFSIVVLVLMALPSHLSLRAQDDALKLGANLVNVPVVVSDRQGRYIAGLKKEDFTVYQDGIKQKISIFATEEEPLNIALIIDTSRSTHDVLGNIKKSAIDFVKRLRPQDKAMVVSCDYKITLLSPLTADRKTIENGIKQAREPKKFGTVLRDTIELVVRRAFAGVKGRKATIMLTDGKDYRSHLQTDRLMELIEESDTMIYSIYYETTPGGKIMKQVLKRMAGNINRNAREKNAEAVVFLQAVADSTAGQIYKSGTDNLKKSFDLILDELRQQYFIGYYLEDNLPAGQQHRITVTVLRPDLAVRARRFYRVRDADPEPASKP